MIEGEVDSDGQLESLESSLSGFDCIGARCGIRNEVRRGAFRLKFVDENLDSGTWGTWSVLVTGVLSGAINKGPGRVIFRCRGGCDWSTSERSV